MKYTSLNENLKFSRIIAGCMRTLDAGMDGNKLRNFVHNCMDMGIDTFVFSGYPHLEEAYRFAELVFPLLPDKLKNKFSGLEQSGPFGGVLSEKTH